MTRIGLDATVVTAHSDKERAEPDFTGYGHHPVIAACDNIGEPLAWMLRPGSAGSNAAADHLRLLDDAITALPPALWCKLMITYDGAGASHALVTELDRLASRHGYQVTYSVGWELAAREKTAIGKVPETACEIAVDGNGQVRERRADDACGNQRCAHRECWIEEARVAELTGLLREGPAGDQLKGWPKTMRGLRPPRAAAPRRAAVPVRGRRRLALLPVGHQPARRDQGLARPVRLHRRPHRVHARVEDVIRTGKNTGLGHSHPMTTG